MKIRERIFPVYFGSYAKFFLLAAICFIVCMNYTILRNLKDTLVISQPELGLQSIPFLKTWMLMPCMLLFIKIYAYLSARYSQSFICYGFLGFYFLYFLSFVFIFFPFDSFFRLDSVGDWIRHFDIHFFNPIGEIVRFWTFSLYYCLSEVWGPLVVLLLFWGTSNRSTHLEEAKRFYSPLLFITNFSGMAASQISLEISRSPLKFLLFPGKNSWDSTLLSLTLFISITTFLAIGLLFCFNHFVLKNTSDQIKPKTDSQSKEKMTLLNIIRDIGKNKKFIPLMIMTFAYFFTNGVVELVWKYYLHQLYPNPNDFNDFLSHASAIISIVSMALTLFFTGDLIQKFSWKISALITPIILSVILSLFFLNFLFCKNLSNYLYLATFLGAAYFCANRICKFTFFDLSKEIATVEFSYEEQIKAKTMLDGIVTKVGKTGESLFLQVLFIEVAAFSANFLLIFFVLFLVHSLWVYFLYSYKVSEPSSGVEKA